MTFEVSARASADARRPAATNATFCALMTRGLSLDVLRCAPTSRNSMRQFA